ncbi:MAG: succinoglycan biosynthesis protein ExoA [Pseudonocardiales bacterium]|nr:succinoglycan biosynthesis protein ExoA [Pseudonocardiales bacterium]
MPVLNEENYVERAVASIQEQEYPGPVEIVLAVGPSTDGTDEVIARLAAADPRIRTLRNPDSDVPTGLNRAMRSATQPVIIRADAHTELPKGYTRRAVRTLLETGAANVGGVMVARGKAGVQKAVAQAYNSRWGLGGGAYHSATAAAGPAESAYLGVMRADALREVGYLDPTLRRGQDWELNYRLRRAGHLVWLDPALRVRYWPRASVRALWRQMYATGIWRGEIVRRHPTGNSARYFAPPALILATALTLLLPATPSTEIVGWPAGVGALGLAAYLTVLTLVTSRSGGTTRDRVRFALVLAVMHYAWGSGFLRGVARGARDAVDTSRVSGRRRVATVELRQFPPVRATVDTEPVGVGRP